MKLRNAADVRTLLWAALMLAVLVYAYARPEHIAYVSVLSFYFAMAAGTIAHNHNHAPTFVGKRANALFSAYISIFYGYPSFAWVPTHNLNHHRLVNKPGDATITWRHTNRNHLFVALTYFFVSAYYQAGPIQEYIAKSKTKNPDLHRRILTQYAVWISGLVAMFVLAVALHGWGTGAKVYFLAFGLPSLFGSYSMMWFNYMQHVHCDPWSKDNHSRNITGRVFNFLVFNAGLHTVHHENAALHWSQLPAAHAKREAAIHPDLKWRSFWWWVLRGYLIPLFIPSLETKQIGRAPFDVPGGKSASVASESVDAVDVGQNAQMA